MCVTRVLSIPANADRNKINKNTKWPGPEITRLFIWLDEAKSSEMICTVYTMEPLVRRADETFDCLRHLFYIYMYLQVDCGHFEQFDLARGIWTSGLVLRVLMFEGRMPRCSRATVPSGSLHVCLQPQNLLLCAWSTWILYSA